MRMRQPDWPRVLPTGMVLGVARLGPLGRLPAPGTWGSAAGVLFFIVFLLRHYPGGDLDNLALSLILGYLAIGFCGEAESRLGQTDPGEVNFDEFAAVPLCFLGWTSLAGVFPGWIVLLGGFALFRLFDITKPVGIRRLQVLPAGWGIVLDDTAAAAASCVSLHAIAAVWRALH